MIVRFPDLERFRLALLGGALPLTHALKPGRAAQGPSGVTIEPEKPFPAKVVAGLAKLGIETVDAHSAEPTSLARLAELLPLTPSAPPEGVPKEVLFDLPRDRFGAIVTELLRLGNDRQRYRFVSEDRVLLLVSEPPLYAVFRASDDSHIGVYVNPVPGVWLPWGWTMLGADALTQPSDRFLVVPTVGSWQAYPAEGWNDVYAILDLKLPHAPQPVEAVVPTEKLSVPLRLTAGDPTESAQLWVLTENAEATLDAFVRTADVTLTEPLRFAVLPHDDGAWIVLRFRPGRAEPPTLPIVAQGYRTFRNLPNLFLPVGTRLTPALRRETIRTLLAEDADRLTWLQPTSEGAFTPISIPEGAFRPLSDWVAYIVDQARAELDGWIAAFRFDFERFRCTDEANNAPPATDPHKDVSTKRSRPKAEPPTEPTVQPLVAVPVERSEERLAQRDRLEAELLELAGPLDSPERLRLWGELAEVNIGLGLEAEALTCRLHATWNDGIPPAFTPEPWPELTGFARAEDVRRFIRCLLTAAHDNRHTELRPLTTYLDANEDGIGLREAWSARMALDRLGADDPLALARARDRLLERLRTQGVHRERDLPRVLRFAAGGKADRMRRIADRAERLYLAAIRWTGDAPTHRPFVDLAFAFGFARLGEGERCEVLFRQAADVLLPTEDAVLVRIVKAFRLRIEAARLGDPHAGPLPAEIRTLPKLADVALDESAYALDRFLELSWILQPDERLSAYRSMRRVYGKELDQELNRLADEHEPSTLARRVRRLLANGVPQGAPAETRLRTLAHALPLAPRVEPAFTRELLALAPAALAAVSVSTHPADRRALEVAALAPAAHLGVESIVRGMFDAMLADLEALPEKAFVEAVPMVAREALRGLRKLGWRAETERLLERIGERLPQVRAGKPAERFAARMALAEGWFDVGADAVAEALLADAPSELAEPTLPPLDRVAMVQAYVSAVGRGPVEAGLDRMETLLRQLPALPNKMTTARWFSRLHYVIVEEIVRTMVSDEYVQDENLRRILDEEESLIRARIHADVRRRVTP